MTAAFNELKASGGLPTTGSGWRAAIRAAGAADMRAHILKSAAEKKAAAAEKKAAKASKDEHRQGSSTDKETEDPSWLSDAVASALAEVAGASHNYEVEHDVSEDGDNEGGYVLTPKAKAAPKVKAAAKVKPAAKVNLLR